MIDPKRRRLSSVTALKQPVGLGPNNWDKPGCTERKPLVPLEGNAVSLGCIDCYRLYRSISIDIWTPDSGESY